MSVIAFDLLESNYDTKLKRYNLEKGNEAAERSDGSYEFVESKIKNEDLINSLQGPVDYVYHQAAVVGVRDSIDTSKKYGFMNVDRTLSVLNAALDHSVNRVAVTSSSSVYGKPKYLPYYKEHPNSPVSPYAVSKLTQEHCARGYHELHGLPSAIPRYFTVYGPPMRPNIAISNFVSRCVNGETDRERIRRTDP